MRRRAEGKFVPGPDIFLSYNRDDAERAKQFAEAFAAEGFEVWWDAALRSGEAYDQVTEEALSSAKAVVVLWSPRSVVSRWVRAEATEAERNKTLLPVMIEPCKRPIMFELVQTADLTGWEGDTADKAWRDFSRHVSEFIGKEADAAPARTAQQPAAAPTLDAEALHGVPFVVLLPISVRGDDDELELLAEDLTEELTIELARDRMFRVIGSSVAAAYRGQRIDHRKVGRELSVRYLIEGKLQRIGGNLRLILQLVDAETAGVWRSDKYTVSADDLAQALEELTILAAGQTLETLLHREFERANRSRASNTGWDQMLRAGWLTGRIGSRTMQRAREEAERGVETAPEYGVTRAILAWTRALELRYAGEDVRSHSGELHRHIDTALERDGDNPFVLGELSFACAEMGDGEEGLRLAQRANSVNPNSPFVQSALARSLFAVSRFPEALDAIAIEERISPQHGLLYISLACASAIHLLDGDIDRAEQAADRSLSFHPGFAVSLRMKAIICELKGNQAAAEIAVRRLHDSEPEMSLDTNVSEIGFWLPDKKAAAEWGAILRKLWTEAGLPE